MTTHALDLPSQRLASAQPADLLERLPRQVTPDRVQEATPGLGPPPSWMRSGRTLLVASSGGHLDELVQLRSRLFPLLEDVEWATFETEQAANLLADETVHYVPFVRPKDVRGTVQSAAAAARLLGSRRYVRVISTGAAVAVPFLARARAMGIAGHFIESAARSAGVSMSGNLVAKLPGMRLYGQYPNWTSGRWQYRGSVFDAYEPDSPAAVGTVDKVVVTMGTQRDFGFRRAIEALQRLLPAVCTASPTILWQSGATDISGIGIDGRESVPHAELDQAVAEADLVVGHAGVGTSLMSLDHGRCPLLLPRRAAYHEHTDDHQRLVAEELGRRSMAVWADPSELTELDLLSAAAMRSHRATRQPDFILQPD